LLSPPQRSSPSLLLHKPKRVLQVLELGLEPVLPLVQPLAVCPLRP
jgi:hypothetical protein